MRDGGERRRALMRGYVVQPTSGSFQCAGFAELLGSVPDTDPEWPALDAGRAVVRLLDTWLVAGPAGASDDAVAAARGALGRVCPTSTARRILTGIVDAGSHSPRLDPRRLVPRVMAYGRSLEYDARWAAAIDVYGLVVTRIDAVADADIVIDAHLRMGYCLRMQGDLTGSESAFAQAKEMATAVPDEARLLHAHVGEAALAAARGNLPLAESILDRIIAAATHSGLTDLRAIALHDRSAVAYWRGQHDQAVRLGYDALQLTHSLTSRDRILNDLALAFTQLGMLETARDAFLVLTATAQEQQVRWLSMINLLEVAALQTNEPLFEHYRRDLLGESLPPAVEAQYHYYVAFGYRALGKAALALRSLERATMLAETHRYNHLMFQIDELRAAVARGEASSRTAAREMPAELQDVADAVSEMRELAGV